MGAIDGVDAHAKFFPIKFENDAPQNINENNNINTVADTTGGNSEFQVLLKSLIDNMTNNALNSMEDNPQDNAANLKSLLPGADKNTNMLLSLLGQLQQSGADSQDSKQNADLLLAQLLSGFDKIANKNATTPITDASYSQAISKYMQAMRNSQNTFNSLATGALDGVNMNAISKMLSSNSGAISNLSGATIPGVNPAKQEIISYISEECKNLGIPEQLALATATTESDMTQFDKDGTPYCHSNPGSTDWGIMQVNDKAWGDVYDMNLIKSDWKYNVRAGLQILKYSYDAALKNNEGSKGANSFVQNLARAAYAGYNAGIANLWRYRTPASDAPRSEPYDVLNNEGYDIRDMRFWDNYLNLAPAKFS